MRVVIGMETSGEVRDAFLRRGHDAISVDLLPHQTGGPHVQGDLFEFLATDSAFDLGIFHPECTYHTVSAAWAFSDPDFSRYPGVGYHQKVQPGTKTGQDRRNARDAAEDDVRRIRLLPIRRKVMENPRGTIPTRLGFKPSQVIQPSQFGADASKGTCLWFWDQDGNPLPDMMLRADPAAFALPRLVCQTCGATSDPANGGGGGRIVRALVGAPHGGPIRPTAVRTTCRPARCAGRSEATLSPESPRPWPNSGAYSASP